MNVALDPFGYSTRKTLVSLVARSVAASLVMRKKGTSALAARAATAAALDAIARRETIALNQARPPEQ